MHFLGRNVAGQKYGVGVCPIIIAPVAIQEFIKFMIPKRYENAEWEKVSENIRKIFIHALGHEKGVYIHGAVGTGKTYAAYAFKKHWDEKRPAAALWNVSELIHELKLDFDRREKNFIGERILDTDRLLILDDIGAEKPSEWVAETIYLIVNRRYNAKLPTIFTSNLSPGELADHVGDRIASRIVEMCEIINLGGVDRRLNS